MSSPRRRADVILEDVPGTGEAVLLDPVSGRVLALNAMGAAVWDLLDGELDASQIASALAAAAGVERAQADADVRTLLAELEREGFLGAPRP